MARAAQASPALELVGVYEPDPTLRERAAARSGLPFLDSLDAAFAAKPAVALIASAPAERIALVERAVAEGAAALVDNPLAVTREALDRLIAAHRRTGKIITNFQPLRGEPMILAAKAALDAGRIGRLVRIYANNPHRPRAGGRPAWHWTREGNGGILLDIGTHNIDMAVWLNDAAPAWVSALHGNWAFPDHPEFQDFAQAQFRFPNGVLANIEADWLATDSITKAVGDPRIWFQGTRGKIELLMGETESAQIWTAELAGAPLDHAGYPSADIWTRTLIEDLATGGDGGIPQEQVWQSTRAGLAAFESAEQGGTPVTSV